MKGSDPSQKRKNDTKSTVFVPELGIPFLMPPCPGTFCRISVLYFSKDVHNTYCTPIVPDRADHEVHASAADPCLHTVPDASHGGTVEDWPQSSPDPKGSAIDDRKRDVICGANAASQADKASRDRVAKLSLR